MTIDATVVARFLAGSGVVVPAAAPGQLLITVPIPATGLGPFDLSDLATGLLDAPGLHSQFPKGFPLDAGLTLRALQFTTDGSTAAVVLDWPSVEWELFESLTLKDPTVSLRATHASHGVDVDVVLECDAELGGLPVRLAFGLPGPRAGLYLEGDGQPLAELLARFHLGGTTLDGLRLTTLDLSADLGSHDFSLSLGTTGSWPPLAGPPAFAVKDLHLNLEYNTERTNLYAGLAGAATLGSLTFTARAARREGGAWEVAGTLEKVSLTQLLTELGAPALPPAIPADATLDTLSVAFDTGTDTASVNAEVDLAVGPSTTLTAALQISVERTKDGPAVKVGGSLTLGSLSFDLAVGHGPTTTTIGALYDGPGGGAIDLKTELLSAFSSEPWYPALPSGLTFQLNEGVMVYEHTTGPAKAFFLFEVAFGASLSELGDLPVVGSSLGDADKLAIKIRPLFATPAMAGGSYSDVAAVFPSRALGLPDGSIPAGLTLGVAIQIGNEVMPLSIPLVTSPGTVGSSGNVPVSRGSASDPTVPPSGITWIDLQRSFGVLEIQRVGLSMNGTNLTILLDGSVTVAGLSLTLLGLSAALDLGKVTSGQVQPEVGVHGLGLELHRGELEVGGAMTYARAARRFDGTLAIRTSAVQIAAVGSFSEIDGRPSFFLYAVLDDPLGGPAFFFVTGLAGGLGINRAVRVPTVDQVSGFPFVQAAVGASTGTPTPFGGGVTTPTPDAVLEATGTWLPAKEGAFFGGIGVRFSSFQLLDSFALLIIRGGDGLEFDLIGLSTAVLPPAEAGVAAPTPLARVQIALVARFVPAGGFLGVDARLTSASFLLSPNCRLQGGAALYLWMAGPHAGDFVMSVGGYHPDYHPPQWYPAVPRLGFSWQVDAQVSIKGSAYGALTSGALMAGGSLSTSYHSGTTRAWFCVGADFLVSWKPFHYQTSAYVSIGAQYTLHFFGTHHLEFDAGATVALWGPEFGGHAQVHVKVLGFKVTFAVDFGTPSDVAPPLHWSAFKASFLSAGDVLSTTATSGLVADPSSSGASTVWAFSAREMAITVSSTIPSMTMSFTPPGGPTETPGLEGMAVPELGPHHLTTTTLGVAPMMNGTDTRLGRSSTTLTITSASGSPASFTVVPVAKRVPAALWGTVREPSLTSGDAASLLAVTDFVLRSGPPLPPRFTTPVGEEELAYELELHSALAGSASPDWDLAADLDMSSTFAAATRGHDPSDSIDDPVVSARRDEALTALGITTLSRAVGALDLVIP